MQTAHYSITQNASHSDHWGVHLISAYGQVLKSTKPVVVLKTLKRWTNDAKVERWKYSPALSALIAGSLRLLDESHCDIVHQFLWESVCAQTYIHNALMRTRPETCPPEDERVTVFESVRWPDLVIYCHYCSQSIHSKYTGFQASRAET